jgi:hypothetical protein
LGHMNFFGILPVLAISRLALFVLQKLFLRFFFKQS